MTVTEGKQELIAFACMYYAKGMLDDKEYEALKLAIQSLENEQKLKEAIGKIKEEIELVTKFGNSFQPIEHGLLFSIIDKHTEGLV